jgi:sialate O-acetylesterase
MRRSHLFCLLTVAGAFLSCVLQADVSVPHVFGSGMVLQRDAKLPVWGWASPGEEVTVSLAGKTARTTATDKGEWRVNLPPMPAGGPHTLAITGSNALSLDNVLVGEVWLCSGQSNMEFPLSRTLDAQAEIASADLPDMRLFRVSRANKGYPQKDVPAQWQVCTPETVPGFTAVGFLFGRRIHQELNVPVGLIESSWGGTRIEPWTPPEGFAAVPRLRHIAEQVALASPWTPEYKALLGQYRTELTTWHAAASKALADQTEVPPRPAFPASLRPLQDRQQPAALYNGMIHGIVPYAIRGALWYQGESNRGDGLLYLPKMEALVKGWRTIWRQGDFPFYFVQLAPFNYGGSPRLLPRIWEAQTRASTEIPNAGMAVINDVGNLRDIHPRNKQVVADRLARLALAKTYDKTGVQYASPSFAKLDLDGPKAVVHFANTYDGLRSRDGKPLTWFELVDAENGVLKADARIVGKDAVEVTAPGATRAIGVRFAWNQSAEPNLVNRADLPAGAFRAGDMPVRNTLAKTIPAAKGYTTLYVLDIPVDCGYDDNRVQYAVDSTKDLPGPFDRVAYCLELKPKDKPLQYVFVAMDAFTKTPDQLGVPTVSVGKVWQQDVGHLVVASNVPGVPVGEELGTGSIEFWPSNYGPKNERPVPGASSDTFDFGDSRGRVQKGYGSMQIHLPSGKTTLLAFNRWGPKGTCEAGIGNSPEGNPDWTFTSNAASYELRRLTVLVRIDE